MKKGKKSGNSISNAAASVSEKASEIGAAITKKTAPVVKAVKKKAAAAVKSVQEADLLVISMLKSLKSAMNI